jgi:hypothetical protein
MDGRKGTLFEFKIGLEISCIFFRHQIGPGKYLNFFVGLLNQLLPGVARFLKVMRKGRRGLVYYERCHPP